MAHLEFTRQQSNTFVLKINSLIKNEDLVTVFQKMFQKFKYNMDLKSIPKPAVSSHTHGPQEKLTGGNFFS